MASVSVQNPIINQQVLARWTDGLFYVATVQEIDSYTGKCLLRFQDEAEFWVLLKDLQRGQDSCEKWHTGTTLENGKKSCRVCHSSFTKSYKKLLTCKQCQTAVHQHCHDPVIYQTRLLSSDWKCSNCDIQIDLKPRNGFRDRSEPKDVMAKKSNKFITELPYNVKLLTWDAQHKSNVQQQYCYCGQNGDWYMKMIHCFRCRMWYHEACVQCLAKPLLYGDRFYIFVCSVCTKKQEYVQRMDMTWEDVTHLALFNLTIQHRKKFYNVAHNIATWIKRQWLNLQLPSQLANSSLKDVEKTVTNALMNNPKKFQCATEIKQSPNLWGLRVRVPPPAPSFIWHTNFSRATHQLCNSTSRTLGLQNKSQEFKLRKRKRISSPLHINDRTNVKRLHLSSAPSSIPSSVFDGGSCSSLDTIIPCLPHYDADNHPFKTELECNTEAERKKRKEQLIDLFTQRNYSGTTSTTASTSHLFGTESDSEVGIDKCLGENDNIVQAVQRIKSKPGRKTQKDLQLLEAAARLASERGVDLNALCTNSNSGIINQPQDILTKSALDCLSNHNVSISQLRTTVGNYFGAAERLNSGERFHVQGRRITEDGRVQYLIQWQNNITTDVT